MGFHVTIDEDTRAFLHRLRAAPSDVFDKPYKGYLLILAGSSDQKVCEWLKANLKALDSLTGGDVAFAIFARSVPIKLETMGWAQSNRRPKHIGTLECSIGMEAGWNVQSLVKSGRWGMIMDGDELDAVTYAVDDIARNLQILDKLPCVVVMDAIPSLDANVIRLSDTICERFIELLRHSLTAFSQMNGYQNLEVDVKYLLSLFHAIGRAKSVEGKLKADLLRYELRLQDLQNEGPVSKHTRQEISGRLETAKKEFRDASFKKFKRALIGPLNSEYGRFLNDPAIGFGSNSLAKALSEAKMKQPIIWTINKTITSLRRYDSIPDKNSPNAKLIFSKYLPLLLPSFSISSNNVTNDDIESAVCALEVLKEEIVQHVFALLPTPDQVLKLHEARNRERFLLDLKVAQDAVERARDAHRLLCADPERPIRDAKKAYTEALNSFLKSKPPSLWKAMSDTLRTMKLGDYTTNIRSRAYQIASGVFEPEFLMRVFEASAKQ